MIRKRFISAAISAALLVAFIAGAFHAGHAHDHENKRSECSICHFQQASSCGVASNISFEASPHFEEIEIKFLYVSKVGDLIFLSSKGSRSPPVAYIL